MITITSGTSFLTIDEFQTRWIDVRDYGGKNVVYNTITGRIMKKGEFCRGHSQPVQLSDGTYKKVSCLMKPENQIHRTIVDELVFDPSLPPGVGYGASGTSFFNRWRRFDVVNHAPLEDPASHCRSIFRYFTEVLGQNGQQDLDYLWHWLAWNVQNPAMKPSVAIVMSGAKGGGKTTYAVICRKIFAPYSVKVESSHLIFGRFNAVLDGKLLVNLEEAFWATDGKQEDRAKDLITGGTFQLEKKGIDPIELPSFFRLVVTTNHEHAVPASLDERRFAVFDIAKVSGWSDAQWDDLYGEIDGIGLVALYQILERFPLNGWHPARNVPQNNALARQKIQSLGGTVEGFVLGCLQNESLPQDSGSTGVPSINWSSAAIVLDKPKQEALLKAANQWRSSQYSGRFQPPWTWQKLLGALKKLGAVKARVNGNSAVEWTIPDYGTASQNFANALGVPPSALAA